MGVPKGHRALIAHLVDGGLVQQDESGLAWVSPTRCGGLFRNEAVAYVQERGFSHFDYDAGRRLRYLVAESKYAGKLQAVVDTTPARKRKRKEPA